MSTREQNERIELLQGTLDLLILHTLQLGPMHERAIAEAIEVRSDEVLQVGALTVSLRGKSRFGHLQSRCEVPAALADEIVVPARERRLIVKG
jgi:PadR family transcriptional regulator PadR